MKQDRLFIYDDEFDANSPQELIKIWPEIDLEQALMPTNYTELEECYLTTGKTFNPQFKYDTAKLQDQRTKLDTLVHGLAHILANIEPAEDIDDRTRPSFVLALLIARLHEYLSMREFVDHVLAGRPERGMKNLITVYGDIDQHVTKFAKDAVVGGWKELYDEVGILTVTKNSDLARERLRKRSWTVDNVAHGLKNALFYLLREPIMSQFFNVNNGFEVRVESKYDKLDLYREGSQVFIGVPENCCLTSEELLTAIAQIVEGKFRTLALTTTFVSRLLGKDSPLFALAPLLAQSLDDSFYLGFAKSCAIYVKGIDGMPEPYDVLATGYSRHKHNFAETLSYIYKCALGAGLDNDVAREKAWEATTRTFLGKTNTNEKTSYAFLASKAEFCGLLNVYGTTEDGYCYIRNLAPLKFSELQCACIGGWLDDADFSGEINCQLDVVDYMYEFL